MLTSEDVRHIARLARVGVSDEEIERMRLQLSQVLDHFQVLVQLDTAGVPPTGHAVPLRTVMRQDEPQPSFPADAIMANAPQQEEGSFRVRAVLEF